MRPLPERLLDVLNILLSDVRYGLGAYLGVFLLSEHHWDEASIGLALSLGGLAGLVSATPMGALVDAVRDKRWLIAFAAVVVTGTCLAIPLAPRFGPVVAAGVIGSIIGTLFAPAVAAMSLGMVGHARFPERAGRNEAMFHAGNAACNVVVLGSAFTWGTGAVFWVLAGTALASVGAVLAIPKDSINADLARGFNANASVHGDDPTPLTVLMASRPLMIFAGCGGLFHLANGAMLGLVGQKLAHLVPGQGITLTAACAIAAQLVMVPTATIAGLRADRWGRKPLFGAAFLALAARGALYTLSDEPAWLIGVQLLDGVGAGLTGALFPVIVDDLTRGSGHFAMAQAGVGTLQGIGGTISATIAGATVVEAGYSAAFLMLASIAAAGGVLFWLFMPETHDMRSPGPAGPEDVAGIQPMGNANAALPEVTGQPR
jgi:predicted MFS family arabinose efflux permease